jgi:hypothetical protein
VDSCWFQTRNQQICKTLIADYINICSVVLKHYSICPDLFASGINTLKYQACFFLFEEHVGLVVVTLQVVYGLSTCFLHLLYHMSLAQEDPPKYCRISDIKKLFFWLISKVFWGFDLQLLDQILLFKHMLTSKLRLDILNACLMVIVPKCP